MKYCAKCDEQYWIYQEISYINVPTKDGVDKIPYCPAHEGHNTKFYWKDFMSPDWKSYHWLDEKDIMEK